MGLEPHWFERTIAFRIGASWYLLAFANRRIGVDAMTQNKPAPLRVRAIWPVIRAAGLVPWTIAFMVLFIVAVIAVNAAEPSIGGVANTAWLMFQVVTTIGLGDFTCTSVVGRIAAIALSIYSVLFLALITGAVVSYCQERMKARRNESVARFIDQLEHLPELSHDELVDLSEKVKRVHRNAK